MNRRMKLYAPVTFLVIGVLLSCCTGTKAELVKGVYYWKSDAHSLSYTESHFLFHQNIKKLYVKLFEVVNHPVHGSIPEVKTQFNLNADDLPQLTYGKDTISHYFADSLNVVPTVFIHNGVFFNITAGAVDTLADNVSFLIRKHTDEKLNAVGYKFNEIQIDCDWTATTRDNYFLFLNKLKVKSNKIISVTLRLYPYKFQKEMGVPPADRATLMCYNLIAPMQSGDKNSILDLRELEKYLNGADEYPLELDVVLPMFYWCKWYHNNEFQSLVQLTEYEMKNRVTTTDSIHFTATEDFYTYSDYIKQGDVLKPEEVNEETMLDAIDMIQEKVKLNPGATISFFHLDTENISHYDEQKINYYYSLFTEH